MTYTLLFLTSQRMTFGLKTSTPAVKLSGSSFPGLSYSSGLVYVPEQTEKVQEI